MQGQNSLLSLLEVSPPRARTFDPPTSHKSAKKIKTGTRRSQILRAILDANRYGSTSFEIADDLGISRDSVSPHMKPLFRLGFLVQIGVRENPKTKNECEVWHLTESGITLANSIMPIARRVDHICECKHCGRSL